MRVLERQAATWNSGPGTFDIPHLVVDQVQTCTGPGQPAESKVRRPDVISIVVLQQSLDENLLGKGIGDAQQAEIGFEGACLEIDIVVLPPNLGVERVTDAKSKGR